MNTYYIDTDVGYDDLIAILMLITNKEKNYIIKAISTVTGVSNVAVGTKNILNILASLDIDIPVFQGSAKAILEKENLFPKIDIERADKLSLVKSTLGKRSLSNSKTLDDLISQLNDESKPVTYICIGPLTNIAWIIQNHPSLFYSKVQELIIMGGVVEAVGVESGLTPPYRQAEYNSALDPEAAKIVMEAPIKKTLIPIDVTYQVPACLEIAVEGSQEKNMLTKLLEKAKTISNTSSLTGRLISEIIIHNKRDFDCFYDLVVAATIIDPEMIRTIRNLSFTVSLEGVTRGRTIECEDEKNVFAIVDIEAKRFYSLLESYIV